MTDFLQKNVLIPQNESPKVGMGGTEMWNSGYNFVDWLDKEVILLHIFLSLLIEKHPFSLKMKFKLFFSLNQEIVLFSFLICQGLTDKFWKLQQNCDFH